MVKEKVTEINRRNTGFERELNMFKRIFNSIGKLLVIDSKDILLCYFLLLLLIHIEQHMQYHQ